MVHIHLHSCPGIAETRLDEIAIIDKSIFVLSAIPAETETDENIIANKTNILIFTLSTFFDLNIDLVKK